MLNISNNIVNLRHKKNITQKELASFLNVTKASVSKWETGLSNPDITLLPKLATFFDISIDTLMGYNPQLSKKQIQKLYQEFAKDFSVLPFEEVQIKIERYTKQYYSCYPFIFQICALWLNHYLLAKDINTQKEILNYVNELCEHIKENSNDVGLCSDTIILQAMVNLQLGNIKETINILEDELRPLRLSKQSDSILTLAYIMENDLDKAESFTQISMFINILSIVENAGRYLSIKVNDVNICEKTINRVENLIESFNLTKLHPNVTAAFEYQVALYYLSLENEDSALKHLNKYISCLSNLIVIDNLSLHGDDYFTRIDEWIEELDMGKNAPRNKSTVLDDIKKSFDNPQFEILEGNTEFEKIKNKLKEIK
ncbi:helix-turn-helix domain-containing protein [Miniphocaeibacter massiliensis]|uniref:helix-turn-helix domain-containing protein n=1 Tax=Miniphocaeibacter massiliensis TaxID=2041841 RepID=UPI000C1BE20D|nr:helix-turn-helix transcriptional regulator [Miniphocaeibacter massiliensis]